MTITHGYATLDDYKSFVALRGLDGIVRSDVSDDAVIEMMIEATSRLVERLSGRRFWVDASDTAYYYTAEDEDCLELPDFASITTVSVDLSGLRSYTDLTSTDWEVTPYNYAAEGKPIRGLAIVPPSAAYFPTSRRGVKVTGKRGWSTVPTDVKDAVLEIVNNIYASRSGQTSAGRVSVTASGIVIRPEDIPEFAMAIIRSYRFMT